MTDSVLMACVKKFRRTGSEVALQTASAQAYQVVGALASEAGLFNHSEVLRALDYFGGIANGDSLPEDSFLPWGYVFDYEKSEKTLSD